MKKNELPQNREQPPTWEVVYFRRVHLAAYSRCRKQRLQAWNLAEATEIVTANREPLDTSATFYAVDAIGPDHWITFDPIPVVQ